MEYHPRYESRRLPADFKPAKGAAVRRQSSPKGFKAPLVSISVSAFWASDFNPRPGPPFLNARECDFLVPWLSSALSNAARSV